MYSRQIEAICRMLAYDQSFGHSFYIGEIAEELKGLALFFAEFWTLVFDVGSMWRPRAGMTKTEGDF
jgi:hypothetical protein